MDQLPSDQHERRGSHHDEHQPDGERSVDSSYDVRDGSDRGGEPDALVLDVEVGVVGLDEGVAQDEGLAQLGRQVQSHDAHDADRLRTLIDLENVVLALEGVDVPADGEVECGQAGHGGAVDLFLLASSEALGHFVDDLGGPDDDGGAGVDDAEEVADLVASAVEDDVVHGDGPVVGHLEVVVLELASGVFGVDSTEHDGRAVGAGNAGEVEGEGVALELLLVDQQVEDQRQSVDRNCGPGHPQDAVELGGQETEPVELGDLGEEGVLGGEAGQPGGVLPDEAGDGPRAVGNVEVRPVLDVAGALHRVEVFVEVAGGGQLALLRRHPEVGGAGVEDHGEGLGRSPDLNFTEWRRSYPQYWASRQLRILTSGQAQMLGVSSEGKILLITRLIFSARGPRPMYQISICDSRGVRLRCLIGTSWAVEARTANTSSTVITATLINPINNHTPSRLPFTASSIQSQARDVCQKLFVFASLEETRFIAYPSRKCYNKDRAIITLGNEKMTAFQSLLHKLNLKQLIGTLTRAHQRAPLPFYVLKVDQPAPQLPPAASLALSRKITDESLSLHSGPLSIWSPHHLHRISETRGVRPQNRIILKNPYKSEELIVQALSMGVREMVIDSREQFDKIQSVRKQGSSIGNKEVIYHWLAQDCPGNTRELLRLRHHVAGLFFGQSLATFPATVEHLTQRVLQHGVQLKHLICEGRVNGKAADWEALKEWQRRQVLVRGRVLEKTVDVCDASEVEGCILATRLLCKQRTVVSSEARELIDGLDHSKSSVLVEHEKEQWLLSALHSLPMDQDKYLFDLEDQPGLSAPNAPNAPNSYAY